MLEIVNIRKAFKRPDGSEHRVLEAVSFHVAAGQRAALMGPNGSGKTTLLRIITGELAPTSGSIVLRGSALDALPAYRRARMIGQVHQDSHKDIAADLSIKELLSIALRRNHSLRLQWPTVEETIDSVRPLSGVLADYLWANRAVRAGLLSGGQRQLLALIAATLGSPSVLILDEHLSSLDENYRSAADDLVIAAARERRVCVLAVTHEERWARENAETRFRLEDGRIHVEQ